MFVNDMKSGYKVDWSDEASDNLNSIIEYMTSIWTDREISRFFKKLDDRIALISKNPQTFPQLDFGINVRRSVLSEQTTIYYEIKKESIVIISLFDNRKNPDSLNIIRV